MSLEIERKWLLLMEPLASLYGVRTGAAKIWQGYINTDLFGHEVRIRSRMDTYPKLSEETFKLTVKSDGCLVREEQEMCISEELYNLLKLPLPTMIFKDYSRYDIGGHTVEVSNVDNGEFVYAEVEFDSEESAKAYKFPWPELLIREVTDEPQYKMKNYWKRKVASMQAGGQPK